MKKPLNILFTSVGRRVELIQAFKTAGQKIGLETRIFGADLSEIAPALFFCDVKRKVCAINDQNYIPSLLNICSADRIDLLIPTIDTDLLLLSENKDRFTRIGTRVLISTPDMIHICRDKRRTAEFFIELGLKSPVPIDEVDKYNHAFPCFIKPLDGSSSIDAFKVNNQADLKLFVNRISNYMIQPFIEGTEYTVDIFCDFDGNPIYITPRIRLAVRSGEVLKTQIKNDSKIIAECNELIKKFKPCGPITVQLIREKNTNDDYYIEINPRFGGGAPLSMKAGADSAEALLELLNGKVVAKKVNAAIEDAVYTRFDQSICVSEEKHEVKAVIFDLDDTLYSEKEYIKSGFITVSKMLSIDNAFGKLWSAFESGETAIDTVLKKAEIYSDELKEKCLDAYRKNKPDIHLYKGVIELLNLLRKSGIKVGIITDGRPEGQKAKIEALGLENMVDEIIITDELGGVKFRKPNDIAFRIMQCKFSLPFENIVYVGDNPQKDFIAPEKLGMRIIYFQNAEGLYSVNCLDGIHAIEDIRNVLMI